jgi:uncharacterized protein (TIGR03435 family)
MKRVLALSALTAAVAWAQPEQDPAFEAASVHITPQAQFGYTSFGPSGTNRYSVQNVTLDLLVQVAYSIPLDQISGLEKLGTEHYDLTAKAEDGVLLTNDQLAPRLRRFLVERFKLVIHRDMKTYDGYALVVAKGGPKLKPNAGSKEMGAVFPGGLRLVNTSLAGFALMIRSPAGRPVEDRTGIQGAYDFDFRYARDTDTDSSLPSFFTALQETFGLKLEPAKVTLPILVIDSVDKTPTED